MFRRPIERWRSRNKPLASKHTRAVELQEQHRGWRTEFYEEFSSDEVRQAKTNLHLGEAERLFREVLEEGTDRLTPGQIAVTTLQLARLLHCQGQLEEAQDLYEDVVHVCRLCVRRTETVEWALCRALLRLAELIIREDRQRGELLFAESMEIAERRNDLGAIAINQRAIQYFGLKRAT